MGYAAYMYTNGGLVIWGNDFVEEYFDIDPTVSVSLFGAITVFNGVICTAIGSMVNDKRVAWKKAEMGEISSEVASQVFIERSM